MNIVFLLLGLGLILSGANLLTDGASALARRWGVSDLVIGLPWLPSERRPRSW